MSAPASVNPPRESHEERDPLLHRIRTVRELDEPGGRVHEGRKAIAERDETWRAQVDVVAMDGFTGFKTAAAEELPNAVAVMDPFHVVRLNGDSLDECRRRAQQDLHGHRGRFGDPLFKARRTCTPVFGVLGAGGGAGLVRIGVLPGGDRGPAFHRPGSAGPAVGVEATVAVGGRRGQEHRSVALIDNRFRVNTPCRSAAPPAAAQRAGGGHRFSGAVARSRGGPGRWRLRVRGG